MREHDGGALMTELAATTLLDARTSGHAAA